MVADLELESFKRLNLSEVAASLGYRIDFRASSRNCAVMVQDDGDKIIVTACPDGHFVYFSVRDDRDNGTVIDFVQRRRGGTIGHIRRFLRDWIGSGHNVGRAPAGTFATSLIPIPRDVAGVRASFLRMTALPIECAYLSEVRAIPEWLLSHTSVEESVRVDSRGNACFAHHNADGLCGYEIKNRGFTGFASGGVKGLWIAGDNETATTLAVSETALDSLSYAAIHGIAGVRLASVAGQMNPDQPKLLRSAMQQLPTGGRVVSAMDRDAGGDALARQRRDRTNRRAKAWNDLLKRQGDRLNDIRHQHKRNSERAKEGVRSRFRPEWSALLRRQEEQVRAFETNEERFMGRMKNVFSAIDFRAIVRAGDRKHALGEAFDAIASKGARLEALKRVQEKGQRALLARQRAEEKRIVQQLRDERNEKLATQRAAFINERMSLVLVHDMEDAAHRHEWRRRSQSRRSAYGQHRSGEDESKKQDAEKLREQLKQDHDKRLDNRPDRDQRPRRSW